MIPILTHVSVVQHSAQAASLAAIVTTSAFASVEYAQKESIDWEAAACICAGALATVRFGAKWSFRLPGKTLSKVFACFMLVCGPAVPLLHTETMANLRTKLSHHRSPLLLGAIGCAAGFLSGLLGVGGGVVITPLLACLSDLPQHTVLGTSLASMVLPSLASLYAHAAAGKLNAAIAIPLALGALIGSTCGAAGALKTEEQPLRILFAVCLVGTGLRMLLR